MSRIIKLKFCAAIAEHGLRTMIAFGLFASLLSCSPPAPITLNIERNTPGGLRLEQIQSDPKVFKISRSSEADVGADSFLTALKTCGIQKRFSPIAATRRLLVGLRDINFVDHRTEDGADGGKIEISEIDARLDDVPLKMMVYSSHPENCFVDLVVWTPVSAESPPHTYSTQEVDDLLALFRDVQEG